MAGIPYLLFKESNGTFNIVTSELPIAGLFCRMFLVLLYNSYEIISNIAATDAGLPRSLGRAVSITGGPVSRLRVQRYGDFPNRARKIAKKAAFFFKTRHFVILEIAKRRKYGRFLRICRVILLERKHSPIVANGRRRFNGRRLVQLEWKFERHF